MTNYERENEISTDEIIKRLERCVKRGNRNYDTDIVLDLIYRQQEDIERLQADNKTLENVIKNTFFKKAGLDIDPLAEVKYKSHFVELPCKLGDSIFYIHRSSQGYNRILEVNVFGIVVNIYDDFKKICLKVTYEKTGGYIDMITAIYGVNAFSSREEAVARLKELQK